MFLVDLMPFIIMFIFLLIVVTVVVGIVIIIKKNSFKNEEVKANVDLKRRVEILEKEIAEIKINKN